MSLLFPAYLLGILGLALPWVLHRFSDQQPPVQLFPSKRFLEPTTPPVSRKQTLRYRALFALRILSLLLLCLLFAQPWINSRSAIAEQERHHMIVIDRSLSMRAEGVWPEAIAEASALVDQLAGGSVELIGFDGSVSLLASSMPSSSTEQRSLSSALNDLQPGYAAADYGFLMQRLDRLASEKELPVKVWLISDQQQSALPAQLNALYAPSVEEMVFVPVDVNGLVNVHLAARAESIDGANASVSVTLLASVSDRSDSTSLERTVSIASSERTLAQRTVSLTPGALAVLNFEELVLPAQSNPELVVSLLEPDVLVDDNVQRLPIVQRLPTGIVLLTDQDSANTSASVFITTALETDGVSQVETIRGTALQVPPDTPHIVTGMDLVGQDVDLEVLQFVDIGSNALVFNQGEIETDANVVFEGVGMGPVDAAHPLALGEIDWFSTRFFALPDIALQENDKILLQTIDGQSVLIERTTNRGRLLILNDPLDNLASNLPLQPSFVALMQAMISYFDASTSVPLQVVVGDRLALPANVQLFDSDGQSLLALAERSDSSTVTLNEPGLYSVRSARGEQSLRAILDPNETDISRLDDASIDAWLARYTSTDNASRDSDAGSSTSAGTDTLVLQAGNDANRFTLWQWLLPLVALLIFAEGWVANRHLDVRRDGS